MRSSFAWLRAGLLLAILIAVPAHAAQAPSVLIPPSRADQQPITPTYRRPLLERKLTTTGPAAFAPFQLQAVEVRGSTLPPAVLKKAYVRWLGRTVRQADLKTITDAIAASYASQSNIALYGVSVPAQSFQGGHAVIDATEGFIQGARVVAPQGTSRRNGLLRRYLDRLVAERPLKRSTLERYTALIRDIPGLNPTLAFTPGSTAGAFVLVVTLAPRTAEFGFGVNNRGTAFLGRTQVDLDLALHSLLRQGDDTHLTAAFPTDLRHFQYYAVSHAQPLGATGATLLATAGYLQTNPSFADLHGHALTLGLAVTAPVLRRNDQSLYLTGGLDGVDSTNALLGDEISNDRIRTVRFGATYVRQNARYYLLANGSANLGLDGLGAHVISPSLANLKFTKYTAKLSANIALPRDMVLRLDSEAQYTDDRLPGSEQLALGGDEFGRAYEAAVVAGDRGVAGSAEIAWKLARIAPAYLRGSELYVFTDGGEIRRLARPMQPADTQPIASLGGGGRIAVSSKAVLQIEADRGLLNPVDTENHESWRAIFSVKSVF